MRLPPFGSPGWAALVAQARQYGPGAVPVDSRPDGRVQHLDEVVPVVPMAGDVGQPGAPDGAPVNWKPSTVTSPILRKDWGPNQLETVRWGGNVKLERAPNGPVQRTGDIFRVEGPYPLVWFPVFVCTNNNAANPAPPGVVIEVTIGSGDGSAMIEVFLGAGPSAFAGGFPIPAKWLQARARTSPQNDPLGDDYTVFCSAGLIY